MSRKSVKFASLIALCVMLACPKEYCVVETARQLLREERDKEFEEAFKRNRQTKLDRRSPGKHMVEFKERQRDQSSKKQLEARNREQDEDEAARERILRQIEQDRS
ncbi:UBX domain-containing protein 4 [Sparganum proliferum]